MVRKRDRRHVFHYLFRHSCAQYLRSEECAFRPLDHGLIDALRGVVHHDCACLVVDFGVDFGLSDEIDDPLFTLGVTEAKSG